MVVLNHQQPHIDPSQPPSLLATRGLASIRRAGHICDLDFEKAHLHLQCCADGPCIVGLSSYELRVDILVVEMRPFLDNFPVLDL